MTWKTLRSLCLAALCACAGGKDSIDITKPVTGAEANNAAKAYEKGMQEKKDQNYVEATRLLEYVRTNFPYSQYAALSELALADMSFERDDWTSAATQYQDFVKSHPSHPKADYAAWRVGLAYFEDKPSTFFLLPPAYEKDQGSIRQALEALNRFVNAYPKSEYIPKAKAMIGDCRELLAAHERYVAEFYAKRDQWRGAAQRYLTLADSYGDLHDGRVRVDSLWNAANAWHNANDPGDERKTLQRIVQEVPHDPRTPQAEQRLAMIPANEPGAPPPGKPSPPANEPRPITPVETPSNPGERPQTHPGPGVPPGQAESPRPVAPPEGPKPAQPTNQPAPAPAPPPNPQTPPAPAPLSPPGG